MVFKVVLEYFKNKINRKYSSLQLHCKQSLCVILKKVFKKYNNKIEYKYVEYYK